MLAIVRPSGHPVDFLLEPETGLPPEVFVSFGVIKKVSKQGSQIMATAPLVL